MWFCNDCGHLDKSIKEVKNGCYRYGCNVREKYTCGWLHSDNGLKNMGCSNWIEKAKEIKGQITMEEVLKNGAIR